MIEGHQKCLEALDELTQPYGELCAHFAPIERATGYDRRTVRRYIRALARKGLAEYFRGLCTEDGDFAGAGYCITVAGRSALPEGPRESWQETGQRCGWADTGVCQARIAKGCKWPHCAARGEPQ